MLKKLSISNYILIRELEIDFSDGLTVVTGETGSGKSILLGAIGLILGQRADVSALLDNQKKCIIEGVFRIRDYGLEDFFSQNDLDLEENTVLRREINQNGKSRAFINDTPVGLPLMRELGERLVNIHSQHSVVTLNEADFQMAVLDSYCGQNELFKQYQSGFRRFQKLQRELEEMKKLEARSRGEMDYFIFLLDELRKASLRAGEQEELERRIEILSHAEDIKGSLYASADRLGRSEVNVISLLNEVAQLLAQASRHHPAVSDLLSRIRNNQIDLKDLLKETEKLEEEVQFDPGELSEATARLDLIYGLEKKHQVRTVEELISISSDIENKIVRDGNLEQKINEMEQELSVQHKALRASATSLSLARKNGIKGFEKEVSDRLVQTGMPSAVFRVEVLPTEELGGGGIDTVRFLFSANKGVGPSEISRVASGGELSRLMLSIKSMISRRNLLPTVIFDEIDSGVSGDIAGKVGAIMKKMSAEMQVIAITHLPQIAGKGDHHFCVFKKEVRNVTATQIMKLGQKERVEEIAKMMSNEVVTQAAIRAAKELLN